MPESEQPILLRAATSDDQEFLVEIFASTRDDLRLANLDKSQEQLLIEMQFRARENQYRLAYPNATTSIILEGDKEIGSMIVNRGEHDIHLVDIALLPDWRDRGIGTYVLRTLLDEASAKAQSVCLQVAVTNRAKDFYERLGFSKIKDGGAYISMEWRPRSNTDSELAGQKTAGHDRTKPASVTT
jgi:ribosomal protein S18 acetylase RimI-like enzyme